MAGAFNFQGKVKKTFYILTDDKIGSGPRLKPGVLSKKPPAEKQDDDPPMEIDAHAEDSAAPDPAPAKLTLAAKLAAQSHKRKANENLSPETIVKAKRK